MPFSIVIPIVAGIGNALMAVPMVRQLRRARRDARVTILARNGAMAEVFRRLPEVDDVVITKGGIKGILKTVQSARERAPDLYLVPFPSNRWQYSMLAATSGAKARLMHGYPVGYWRALHFIPATRVPANRALHDVRQNLELLRAIGIEPDLNDAPTFAVTDVERARALQMLSASGFSSQCATSQTTSRVEKDLTHGTPPHPDPLQAGEGARGGRPIIVHAGSARTVLARAKRWPEDQYAQLICALDRRFPGRVMLVEGPDESGVADEIRDAVGGNLHATVVKLAGPLGEAAALLEGAALYVGSDSGLAHLAAAVGTTPVTIFGPADPDRVCPFGYRDLVVQSQRNCEPCFLYPWESTYPKVRCRPPFCIEGITVEQVMEAVDRAASALTSARTSARSSLAPSLSGRGLG